MGLFSEDLFPTKWSFIVFVSYMALFINQGILVTASKNKNNTYNYNTVTVVLLTEVVKLVASTLIYLKDNPFKSFGEEIYKHRKILIFYFVPAALYCLYNNLQFVNLSAYDPTTYYLLLQFRVVVTGVVFQYVFNKKLTQNQWISLVFLTFGCILKQYGHGSTSSTTASNISLLSYINPHLALILLQVFSSCFAGVYNEYLLKDKGVEVHLMLQNVFMYVDSIICNAIVLGFKGDLATAFTAKSIQEIMTPGVLVILFNNAAIGIVTSLFLRNLNSILKTFASALELMFTAVLCWIIFGIAIDVYTVVAIVVVSSATILYAQKPVVNVAKTDIKPKDDEQTQSV